MSLLISFNHTSHKALLPCSRWLLGFITYTHMVIYTSPETPASVRMGLTKMIELPLLLWGEIRELEHNASKGEGVVSAHREMKEGGFTTPLAGQRKIDSISGGWRWQRSASGYTAVSQIWGVKYRCCSSLERCMSWSPVDIRVRGLYPGKSAEAESSWREIKLC